MPKREHLNELEDTGGRWDRPLYWLGHQPPPGGSLGVEINVHGAGLEWDSSISYEHPALVTGSDALLYVSVQDSTNVDPVTDSGESHWKPLNTSPPNASATERGVVRLATDAGDETDATGVITPAVLASLGYRRVTVSDSAPTSSDGGDGDVWLEY